MRCPVELCPVFVKFRGKGQGETSACASFAKALGSCFMS